MASEPIVRIRQVHDYGFLVDFGPAFAALRTDEAVPIGRGEGPYPEQLLVAGLTNCLCASLVFALGKYRQEAAGIEAEARCTIERNGTGRLRIAGVTVAITLGAEAGSLQRMDRVLAQFQDFCTVTESVKAGIPVAVSVRDAAGTVLMSDTRVEGDRA